MILTHYYPVFPFYIPWKHQKTYGFCGTKREYRGVRHFWIKTYLSIAKIFQKIQKPNCNTAMVSLICHIVSQDSYTLIKKRKKNLSDGSILMILELFSTLSKPLVYIYIESFQFPTTHESLKTFLYKNENDLFMRLFINFKNTEILTIHKWMRNFSH